MSCKKAQGFLAAQKLEVNTQGDLVLHTEGGDVVQKKPKAYQELDDRKVEVVCSYQLKDQRQVGFELGSYDRSKPLVIDPVIVGYSTYLGGSQGEAGTGIAVDTEGFAYITGSVTSADFPSTNGSRHDLFYEDAFVTKLKTDGSGIEYSTILGGTFGDDGYGIGVDLYYSAYITGPTGSPDYPVVNAYQSTGGSSNGSLNSGFLTKLNDDGTIAFSTYFGNAGLNNRADGIAVDREGNSYIVGLIKNGIEVLKGFQSTLNGFQDGYMAKFSPTGALLYSTYIGGSSGDVATAIATDNFGNAYVTGLSLSTDFPTSSGAYRTSGNGFLTRIDTNAVGISSRVYSTKLPNVGKGVGINAYSEAYVASVILNSNDGSTIVKLNSSGTAALFSVPIPGSVTGIAVDGGGNAWVTGELLFQSYMPTTSDAFQRHSTGGLDDGFVQKFKASDGTILYASLIGGSGRDYGNAIALDTAGNPYITGATTSRDFPVSPNAFQSTNHSTGGGNPIQAFIKNDFLYV